MKEKGRRMIEGLTTKELNSTGLQFGGWRGKTVIVGTEKSW